MSEEQNIYLLFLIYFDKIILCEEEPLFKLKLIHYNDKLNLSVNLNKGFSPHNIILSKYIRDVLHIKDDDIG